MHKIRVLVVDDHTIVRDGICALLALVGDIEVVGEAANGSEALRMVKELKPDVALMDIAMPIMDGLEATRRIKSQLASTSVIVLTVYDNDAYIVDAVRAGAGGYLLKDASRDLLVHTIRAVNSGGTLIKTSLLRQAILSTADATGDQSKKKHIDATAPNSLTPRERDVLRLVIEGQSNKEIGRALSISEDTAKKHVQTILSKLGVSDRTQAAVKAVRAGLVEPFSNKDLQ